eukprot:1151099-Pelagomonas_calceolata.AAC.3
MQLNTLCPYVPCGCNSTPFARMCLVDAAHCCKKRNLKRKERSTLAVRPRALRKEPPNGSHRQRASLSPPRPQGFDPYTAVHTVQGSWDGCRALSLAPCFPAGPSVGLAFLIANSLLEPMRTLLS